MTLNDDQIAIDDDICTMQPKTKHEETMFCIESTNDIVSEIKGIVQEIKGIVQEIKAIVEHVDVARAAREQGLTVG